MNGNIASFSSTCVVFDQQSAITESVTRARHIASRHSLDRRAGLRMFQAINIFGHQSNSAATTLLYLTDGLERG
jgi:hypothetical protein